MDVQHVVYPKSQDSTKFSAVGVAEMEIDFKSGILADEICIFSQELLKGLFVCLINLFISLFFYLFSLLVWCICNITYNIMT